MKKGYHILLDTLTINAWWRNPCPRLNNCNKFSMKSMPTFKILLFLISIPLLAHNNVTLNCYVKPTQCEKKIIKFLQTESNLTVMSQQINHYHIKRLLKKRIKKEPVTLVITDTSDATMRYLIKFKRIHAYKAALPEHFTLLQSAKNYCVTNFILSQFTRHVPEQTLWCNHVPMRISPAITPLLKE